VPSLFSEKITNGSLVFAGIAVKASSNEVIEVVVPAFDYCLNVI
jgi:hypothetical protein